MPSPSLKPPATSRISQKIWDVVAYKLPSVTSGYAARALRFKIRPQQQKHIDLWKSIFRSEAWLTKATTQFGLNPVLIGKDLKHCLTTSREASTYLILVTGDNSGDLRFEKDLFFRSLMPHKFYKSFMKTEFPSRLILNITNVYRDPGMIPVDLSRVFSLDLNQLRTLYLWWDEEGPLLRTVGTEGIVGLYWGQGKIESPRKVDRVCGITLITPKGKKVQYLFEKHGLYEEVAQGAILPVVTVGTVGGWGWRSHI